jgi:hypothetical protein
MEKAASSEQSCKVTYRGCFLGWPRAGGKFCENPLVVEFNR